MYAIGLDYGTNSCRALLLKLKDGNEIATSVFDYPSGKLGILTSSDPHLARQAPQDYLAGAEITILDVLAQAKALDPDFAPDKVTGLGLDTTGSTVIPVDQNLQPLSFQERFHKNLNAHVWLWKDHTAAAEAEEITLLAKKMRPNYLDKCGGAYSSEWWWSKILHLLRCDPEVFEAAHTFLEHCDWLPAMLTGQTDPKTVKHSICSAGHKAMFHEDWGGLPDEEFLAHLDPKLAALRPRLYHTAYPATTQAGVLSPEWADRLGLPADLPVAVGAFDAHMGAVGAGVKPGSLVKIVGTSTCDITVGPESLPDVPGLCGQVPGSVLPGQIGVEAGQSAVGDLFIWVAQNLTPDSYGSSLDEKLTELTRRARSLAPGASGLLALDWNNGNRTILADTRLTGLLLGQTLHSQAHEIYRAYLEATAFGARTIIDRMDAYGVTISEVICTGGLSLKNPPLMQIYADVLDRPLKISASRQTCALGAALFGASCAEAAPAQALSTLQERFTKHSPAIYTPQPEAVAIYQELYPLYTQLHDGFSAQDSSQNLSTIMKELLAIQKRTRV